MGNTTISQTREKRAARALTEVKHLRDVPAFADDEEAAEFWDTHAPGEAFLDEAETDAPDWASPPRSRTTPVAIRFDADTLTRLKAVAKTKHKGYQTLLKEFVAERLYEEEKREGIIPPTEPATPRHQR